MLAAGQAQVVTVSRSYPAELADVWDACTNPEPIPRWFLPVSGELKEGGRYQSEGNAGGGRGSAPGGVGVGWDSGLIGLTLHLTTRQAVDPATVAEWSASEQGHRFLTESSDAWYQARVAFGPAARPASTADRPLQILINGHCAATVTGICPA